MSLGLDPPAGTFSDVMSKEDARRYTRWIAGLRVAIGVTAMVAPGVVTRPWLGRDVNRPPDRLLVRSVGARDAALGLGAIVAIERGAPVRAWLEAGGLADAGDALGALLAFRSLPRLGRWSLLAATSGAVSVAPVLASYVD